MSGPVTNAASRPADEAARERARRDHETTLVIEAGAGTGKTTLLVDRIEAIVTSGRARLDEIAAVTFTENAATTMKLRLRERLERARADPRLPAGERERAALALDTLERAAVTTIHALCAQILQERPLECSVVPGFRMADEAQADALFAEAWEEWLGERLGGGDDVLLDALERGIPLEGEGPWGERTALRGLARRLVDQRDLEPLCEEASFDPEAARRELVEKGARARALAAAANAGDSLGAKLDRLADHAEAARFLEGHALVAHLLAIEAIPSNHGFRPHWPSPEALAEGRTIAAWTKQVRETWTAAEGASLHSRLVRALRRRRLDLRAQEDGARRPRLPRPPREGAQRSARPRRPSRLLPVPLPVPADRRVPGHRPAAGGGRAAPRRRSPGRPRGGRRREAVDLPLPPRRGAPLPRARGPGGRGRGRGAAPRRRTSAPAPRSCAS